MTKMRRLLSGLLPNRRYAVRVRALNRFNVSSNWSEALEFITPSDDTTPNVPSNLSIDFSTPDLYLQWDIVTDNTDGSAIVDLSRYKVTLSTPGDQVRDYETTQTFFSLPFRQNETDFGTAQPEFVVAVRAVDVEGNESDPASGTALNDPPQKPLDPTGFGSFTMLTVSMAPHPDDRDIVSYIVERSEAFGGPYDVVATTSGDTYIDTGAESITYYFRYRVVDVFGQESPNSEILSLETTGLPSLDDEPPEAVADFVAVANSIDELGFPFIDLTWSPNVVDDDLSHFELRALRVHDNFVRSVMIGPGASSYRLSNLEEDTEYQLIIYAYDFFGNRSGPSATLSVTTQINNDPPDTPLNPDTISSFRNITVFWETDFNPRLSHYEVYGETEDNFTPDTTTDSNLLFSGTASRFSLPVSDNSTWYFRLRAVNTNNVASGFTAQFSGQAPDGIESVQPGEPAGAQFRVDAAGNIWIGDDDFADAPFRVSNIGAAQMRNAVITGEDMAPEARIIDTPAFIVTKEGNVTAGNIIASGGTIGGVTINETNLEGGTIQGSTFNIGAGGINFTGSGDITWEPSATGGIELANDGFIRNAAYKANSTTGWYLGNDGIIINEGTIRGAALQIGVSSVNLLANSAFTEGATIADNWVHNSATGVVVSGEITTEQHLYFGRSQRIEVTTGGTFFGLTQEISRPNDEPFSNTETMVLSFWIKQTSGTARLAKAQILSSADAVLFDGNTTTLPANEWVRISAVFRLSSPQSTLKCRIAVQSPAIGNIFFIDGAQFQISDYLTEYAPRPLEIPTNYIQSAWINSLSASRITSGQIASAEIVLTGSGILRNDPQTWQIDESGAVWENGSITIVAGGDDIAPGFVKIDGNSLRLIVGTDDEDVNTKFKVNESGVFIGGHDINTADVYFDGSRTVFRSSTTGHTFTINAGATGDEGDDRVLQLLSGDVENFFLTTEGQAFFHGGTINASTIGYGEIISQGFVSGFTGFRISLDGNVEFADGIFRGTIDAQDLITGTISNQDFLLAGITNFIPDPLFREGWDTTTFYSLVVEE